MGYATDDGLVLIGGGGHALVVAEAAVLSGRTISGYLDDSDSATLEGAFEGSTRIGTLGDLAKLEALGRFELIIALGDLAARYRMIQSLDAGLPKGAKIASIIHPDASVSPSATIEPGVFIGPGAIVHTRASIGAHATINSGAIVEHECVIGANVHVAPGAAIAGRVAIGQSTLVGLGSRILPNLRIGEQSIIGAGAVVVRNAPVRSQLAGVPARGRAD